MRHRQENRQYKIVSEDPTGDRGRETKPMDPAMATFIGAAGTHGSAEAELDSSAECEKKHEAGREGKGNRHETGSQPHVAPVDAPNGWDRLASVDDARADCQA
ncbi:hypothetical protein ACLOJK_017461 [Asimina triloba]